MFWGGCTDCGCANGSYLLYGGGSSSSEFETSSGLYGMSGGDGRLPVWFGRFTGATGAVEGAPRDAIAKVGTEGSAESNVVSDQRSG